MRVFLVMIIGSGQMGMESLANIRSIWFTVYLNDIKKNLYKESW